MGTINANVGTERQMWAPKRHTGRQKGMCGRHKGKWGTKKACVGAIKAYEAPKSRCGAIKANGALKRHVILAWDEEQRWW